jgi:hypothetical protein
LYVAVVPKWVWKRRRDQSPLTTSELRKSLALQVIVIFAAVAYAFVKAARTSGSTEVLLIVGAVVFGLSGAIRGFLLVGSWFLRDKLDL